MSWLLLLALSAVPTPIRFSEAVERSLQHSPFLKVAEQDAARAWAQVEQVRAPSLPTLGVNATYTRLDADRVLNDRVISAKDQLNVNGQLGVPLLAPQRWAQWWRAHNAAVAQRATSDDVRRQVALQAARTWLSVLGQKRVVQAATQARDTAQAHLDFARARREGGIGNRLDEIRAAQELAVSQTQLENAAGQLARLQEALGVVVASEEPLDAATEEPKLPAPPSVEEALGSMDTRLDVKAAQARQAAAAKATHADFTDYLPLITLVAQPFYQNPATLTQPLTGWQATAVLSLPLYDGGLRYGQEKERRALAKTADAQLEQALRQAKSEVRGAFEALKHADEALKAARAAATAAKEARELATVAYSTGVSTNLDVIDAERRERDAEVSVAVAEDASRQARLDLLAAAGKFP